MKSPRWLRPHTITVINVLPEEDGEERTTEATVWNVKVDFHNGATFGNTGRQTTDTVSVVIDANDLIASKTYREPQEFKDPEFEFTLRTGDRIQYQEQTWEITGVERTNPLRNEPEFIEVTAE